MATEVVSPPEPGPAPLPTDVGPLPRSRTSATLLRWQTAAILLLAAAPRIALAVFDHGIFWPDEIYQTLEPAHRAVHGYGFIAWEFRDGARNWFFPGILSGVLRAVSALGIDSSIAPIVAAKLLMVAWMIVGIYACMRLAERIHARSGLIAGLLAASFPTLLVFSHRCMTEVASAPLVVLSLLEIRKSRPKNWAIAGILAGLLFPLRYPNGLVIVWIGGWLLLQRRFRPFAVFAGASSAVVLVGGLLDWATWGQPFHSAIVYIEFNVLSDGASFFGTQPWSFFISTFWSSTGPLALLIVLGFVLGARLDPGTALLVPAYVLMHSFVPHKEYRFILPVIPLMLVVAAAGIASLGDRISFPRWYLATFAVVGIAWMGNITRSITYSRLGLSIDAPLAANSLWSSGVGDFNRMLADVGKQPDLCGVGVIKSPLGFVFTGGYTYLHREIPMIFVQAPTDLAGVNYLITSADPESTPGSPWERSLQRGRVAAYTRAGTCARPADFDWMLYSAKSMGLHPTRLARSRSWQSPSDFLR